MSSARILLCFVCLVVLSVDAIPDRRGVEYNQYSAGAAGGGYAQVSGGSVSGGDNSGRPPVVVVPGRPNGGHSSGHSSGEFDAKGGFVAGGGSVSGSYDKGYNNGHRG